MRFHHEITWDHHYSGWRGCLNAIRPYLEFLPDIDLISCVDNCMARGIELNSPWMGFLHNVPRHPSVMHKMYGIYSLDVEQMLTKPLWKHNLRCCKRIFVLSNYLKKYLIEKGYPEAGVTVIKHPVAFPDVKFDLNLFQEKPVKDLVLLGQWMRNFQEIFDIQTECKKKILVAEQWMTASIKEFYKINDSVEWINWLPNDEFDLLWSSSIAFCPLFDCSACNGIIDCIARNTPILVPKLEAAVEYLGEEYPLYYNTLEEASEKIKNMDNVVNAHIHLRDMNKEDLTFEHFAKCFVKSVGFKFKYY